MTAHNYLSISVQFFLELLISVSHLFLTPTVQHARRHLTQHVLSGICNLWSPISRHYLQPTFFEIRQTQRYTIFNSNVDQKNRTEK